MADVPDLLDLTAVPLFPLPNVVLFPRAVLPLHIFEERYKLMIGEASRDNTEFGIVLAKDVPDAKLSGLGFARH